MLIPANHEALEHYNKYVLEATFVSPTGQEMPYLLYSNKLGIFVGDRTLQSLGINYSLYLQGYLLSRGQYAAALAVRIGTYSYARTAGSETVASAEIATPADDTTDDTPPADNGNNWDNGNHWNGNNWDNGNHWNGNNGNGNNSNNGKVKNK